MVDEPEPSTRPLIPVLLRGTSGLFGVLAALLFFVGGRALHEFANYNRASAEIACDLLAAALGLIAVLIRGLAERLEDHDDGELIRLTTSDKDEDSDTR